MNHRIAYSRFITPILLALLTFLCYLPSLYYAFQFDDLANIVKFYDIRHKTIRDLFFSNTRWISYWLNTCYYQIAKFDPFYYRFGNIIFHCLTGMLVFSVIYMALRGLKKASFWQQHAFSIALFTSAFFLLHPVQTQTVSYVIQGQLEGLAGLFMISVMAAFLLYAQAPAGVKKSCYGALVCLLAFLACGTKEIVIITPLLLLIFDWFLVAQGDYKDLKKRWVLHGCIWLIIGSIYLYFLKPVYFARVFGLAIETHNNIGNVLTANPHAKITSIWYFISQFKVILHYFFIFLWPFSISVDYDWLLVDHFFAPDALLPFIALCCLLFFIYKRLQHNAIDLIAFGLLWFLITILPRSSIIPSTELVADYKTYAASMGLLFLAAGGFVALTEYSMRFCAQHKLLVKLAASLGFLCFLASITIQRNTVWRSGEDFWLNVIRNAPNKARAYNNYGVSLSEKSKFHEAIYYFKKAISMDRYYPDPCNNLAVVYSAVGNVDGAIEAMKQGIAIQPQYPEGYNNLASFLIAKKDYTLAEEALKRALQLRPHYGKAYFNLGRLYLELDKKEEAFECFKSCCMKADFDNDIGFTSYGMISLMLNKPDDALFAYQQVLALKPHDHSARFNCANAYYMKKDYHQALPIYEQLAQEQPHDHKVLFNLAETYYCLKKFKEAEYYFTLSQARGSDLAQIPLRIAACYAHTGNFEKSAQLLKEIIANPVIEEDIKKSAQTAYQQLFQKNKSRTQIKS